MCSLDARSGRPIQASLLEEVRASLEGSLYRDLIGLLCSRNARPQKDEEGAARCPPCSQNAHDETVLVRCAQLRAALATPPKRGRENWKTLCAP